MDQETVEQETVSQTKSSGDNQGLKVFVGVVFIITLVVGAMFYFGRSPSQQIVTPAASSAISPDTVRAVVNGEEIIQKTINDRLAEAEQMLFAQGVDINDANVRSQVEAQIIEDTINYILLKQEATKAGSTVDPVEIEEMFQTFVIQAGGEEQLMSQLQQAGLTEEVFRERLAEQLVIDTYLNDNTSISSIVVTDEDVTAAYNLAVESAPEGTVPPLTDVRDQVEQQIFGQKRQEIIVAFTDTLRANAVIERK